MSIFLPKVVMKTSTGNETSGEGMTKFIKNATKMHEVVYTNVNQAMNEVHQNRMKSLRKELDYLKETEWKYESIDKYIGQS